MSLQTAANIATIGELLVSVVVAFGGGFLALQYVRTMRPVWKRFATNVGRQIAVISTEGQDMTHEAGVLESVGFFKVKTISADERSLDLLHNAVLLVVGYSPKSKVYKVAFEYARKNQLPIIVFSGGHRLADKDRNDLKSYSFSSLCETELRLVSDVFATISTFPEQI